jgi:hypothetical protein
METDKGKYFGKSHKDTQAWTDLPLFGVETDHKVASISIYTDGQGVGGLKFSYQRPDGSKIDGPLHLGTMSVNFPCNTLNLEKDEFVTGVQGRTDELLKYVNFKTNKGRSIDGGGKTGDQFEVDIPSGSHAASFFGGINGHVHYIGCQVLRIPDKNNINQVVRTVIIGRQHDDTNFFDEFKPDILKGQITKLKIYHDDKFILGFETTYELPGKSYRSGVHISAKILFAGKAKKAVLKLGKDEFINEISGNNGEWIDGFKISTNKGNSLEVGGKGGKPFSNIVPIGKKVVSFGGGFGKHLHNFFCYLV